MPTKKTKIQSPTAIELFAGGGGLALGAHLAGLNTSVILEKEKNSCQTLRLNKQFLLKSKSAKIFETDVRDFTTNRTDLDVLMGGPPCQPFSIGGKKAGNLDKRDLFPEYLRVLHSVQPKAFLIENVKGLTSPRFARYLEWVLLSLEFSDVASSIKSKPIEDQLKLLKGLKCENKIEQSYKIHHKVLNAVNYGVPQSRQRIFIVGIRNDIKERWSWPQETHSKDALLFQKFISGEYYSKYGLEAPPVPSRLAKTLESIKRGGRPKLLPWVTTRDALHSLPMPIIGKEDAFYKNHKGIPGARIYPGHTGSFIDDPSKTIKAGVHGCPGGENMIRYSNGTVRYFSVREAARIQTFPDEYEFYGSRTEAMRQIGNAVPVKLAEKLCRSLYRVVFKEEINKSVQAPKHLDL